MQGASRLRFRPMLFLFSMNRAILLGAVLGIFFPFLASAAFVVPNDPFFADQWYLRAIRMEEAWGLLPETAPLKPVVVAVIDTRVDINHVDLKDAIWTNEKEIEGNGIDDDGNGYADDVHGWNFVTKTGDVGALKTSSTYLDAYVHGTAVSSLIAARGNNGIGIAGVAWQAKIMPLVGLDDEGNGLTDRVAEAVDYAVMNGASVINMSIEGDMRDPVLDAALANAKSKGVLTVVAAGNSSVEGGRDLDLDPVYPTCASRDASIGLVAVGATDQLDRRAVFSDYGGCVSLSAPGVDMFVAEPRSTYSDGWSGTSLAAPLVSGAAALLKQVYPGWSPAQVKRQLLETSTLIDAAQLDAYRGKVGSGRLNVASALSKSLALKSFEVSATIPGIETSVFLTASGTRKEVSPFGLSDTRGAHATIGDMDNDGEPEIAVVPASRNQAFVVLYRPDGEEIARIDLPGVLTNGALITAVDGGYVVADADGGAAWGIDGQRNVRRFFPYGEQYRNGMDLLTIQRQAAFAPRNGGGRMVIADVRGLQLVSAFPFGMEPSGRWSLAKMDADDGSFIVFSGPTGSKHIGVEVIGQIGWQPVTFEQLAAAKITLSSGMRTDDLFVQSYGTWNE